MIKSLLARLRRRPASSGPLDCDQVAAILQHYLDGHLDAARAQALEAHLEVCRACGLEAETYEHIKSTLAAHRPYLPEDAVARLREFGEQLARGHGHGHGHGLTPP